MFGTKVEFSELQEQAVATFIFERESEQEEGGMTEEESNTAGRAWND